MAQIQEYLPQVAAPEPVGGMSPNVELAGAAGRGLEKLGGDIEQIGDVNYKRDTQLETADIYSYHADQRANKTDELQQKIQDGSLDVEQFMQDFDDDQGSENLQSSLNTRGGRAFFERQQARLRGQLLTAANHGASLITANRVKGDWINGQTQLGNSVENDPHSFKDAYDSSLEAIDEVIKNGGLPESMRDKAERQSGAELSKAMLRGYAKLGTSTDDQGNVTYDGIAQARSMLKDENVQKFLGPDQVHSMEGEIDRYERADDIEKIRTDKAVQEHQKAAAEKWGQDNLEKLSNNALSTKDVFSAVKDGTLKWEQGEKWLNLIQEGAKQDVKTNPRTKNSLISRIVNPDSPNPITSTDDLMPYVGKGISITDFNQMNGLFKKTPEQQAAAQGEKAMFDSARRTIRFKNPMTNQYDVLGEQKLAQFMSDYTHAKQDVVKQGGKVSDLTDSNSPLYFGSRLEAYQTSMQDQMAHVATDRTNKALGLPRTSPDDEQGKSPIPVSGARKANESPADYLKRMGK